MKYIFQRRLQLQTIQQLATPGLNMTFPMKFLSLFEFHIYCDM